MNVPAWLEPPFGPLSGLHARLLTAPDMDWSAVPLFAVAMAPMAVQAYLIVQPHTRPLRAALGAHGLVLLTHAWMRYRFTGECEARRGAGAMGAEPRWTWPTRTWTRVPVASLLALVLLPQLTADPTWAFLNAATTLFYLFGVLRYAEWMCISDPIVDPRLLTSSSLGNRLLSAVDLCINQRCVGLASVGLDGTHGRANRTLKSAYASPAHPAPWAPTSRLRSVARHAWAAGWRYAVADVVIAFQRSLGAESIAKPGGAPGAIDAFVRTWGRGMGGEVAAWLFAMLLIPAVASLLISTAYHVIAALAVATAWEADAWDTPMFDSFLLADSLNDLWGRRWHQIIRVSARRVERGAAMQPLPGCGVGLSRWVGAPFDRGREHEGVSFSLMSACDLAGWFAVALLTLHFHAHALTYAQADSSTKWSPSPPSLPTSSPPRSARAPSNSR